MTTASTSLIVLPKPSEKRIICRDAADSGFMAFATCDGSSESAKQAVRDAAPMPQMLALVRSLG